ncbi:MAG: T9SS type A sorting domain-containing protein, partial [Ignavibacteriaceae bacterium]|nr:T9SS type A sorting domain-containing protein [Ignavibacteriaceae bacterium]
GQTTYTWTGATSSDWTVSTNWNPTRSSPRSSDLLVFDKGGTLTVTSVQTESIERLTASNNTILTLTASHSEETLTITNGVNNDLVVNSGSSLTIGTRLNITLGLGASANIIGTMTISSGQTFTCGNSSTLSISGTITNSGNISIGVSSTASISGTIINSGTINKSSSSTIIFASGGIYQHSQNGGTVPTATWNANSTCLITGTTSTLPSGMGQTFGHLTWNCTGQTTSDPLNNVFTVGGNFTLNSSGESSQLRLLDGTTNITGNYSQTGGSIWVGCDYASTINIGGNFSLTGGTFLVTNNVASSLNVAGNFTHTAGTITETGASGNIVFNGSEIQNYTGGGTISNTIDFTINNPAGIILLSSATFPAALIMTNGNITTGANTLSLGTSTSNQGTLSRTSGTIIGNFRRWFSAGTISNVLFPIGTSTNYRPVNISFTGAITTGGTLTTFFTATNPGTTGLPLFDGITEIINAGKEGYWTINTGDGLTGGVYSLDLTADGFTGVSIVSSLRLLKRATGGNWTLNGTHSNGTGTITTPVVHRTGMSGFSEFGVGSASDNPLPVELSSFSASIIGSAVKLSWRTETEVNNYGFEVERASSSPASAPDGTTPLQVWGKIGFVEGYGNSNSPKDYSFIDASVVSGTYSYRLKQIDIDGQFEYSKIIEVNLGAANKYELAQNFPNPFNPNTSIKFTLPETGNVKLTVYNMLGQEIATFVNGVKEAGTHIINFNAEELNSGIYMYRIESNGFNEVRKMTLIK